MIPPVFPCSSNAVIRTVYTLFYSSVTILIVRTRATWIITRGILHSLLILLYRIGEADTLVDTGYEVHLLVAPLASIYAAQSRCRVQVEKITQFVLFLYFLPLYKAYHKVNPPAQKTGVATVAVITPWTHCLHQQSGDSPAALP